jgi:SAM-dependent methyltransferase
VLDLGSGAGTTLALLKARGLRPVGADYSPALAAESGAIAPSLVADAERPPFRSGSMDAVLMECVLSAVPDKRAALGEVARILRPGGWLVLSDVVVERALPPPLDSFAGWIACAAGALSAQGYGALLEESGLTLEAREDHGVALSAMLAQVTRRLALIGGAMRAGLVDLGAVVVDGSPIEMGERLLGVAKEAVDSGLLGYGLFVGRAGA